METIISHGFKFSVETEDTHKEELTTEATEAVKVTLDAMPVDRVARLHADILAGNLDGGDYDSIARAGELVSAYEDFGVSITAEAAC
jgi:hypothetical protein